MSYHLNDKFILNGVECYVALINGKRDAYLVPEADEENNGNKLYAGCVFAVINDKGLDKDGNKAISVANVECGAVQYMYGCKVMLALNDSSDETMCTPIPLNYEFVYLPGRLFLHFSPIRTHKS